MCCFWQLELIYHTFGRQNVKKTTVNLDLFLRRFNEIQFWVITEMCLCSQLSKRVQLLKKFIKIATQYANTVSPSALYIAVFFFLYSHSYFQSCKEYKNLNAFFAVTMGLSNPAVCRLNQTWEVSACQTAVKLLLT